MPVNAIVRHILTPGKDKVHSILELDTDSRRIPIRKGWFRRIVIRSST